MNGPTKINISLLKQKKTKENIWADAKNSILKPLNKLLHKAWSEISKSNYRTLNRPHKYKILKLTNEPRILESKI
jgi:hypothetical protein